MSIRKCVAIDDIFSDLWAAGYIFQEVTHTPDVSDKLLDLAEKMYYDQSFWSQISEGKLPNKDHLYNKLWKLLEECR